MGYRVTFGTTKDFEDTFDLENDDFSLGAMQDALEKTDVVEKIFAISMKTKGNIQDSLGQFFTTLLQKKEATLAFESDESDTISDVALSLVKTLLLELKKTEQVSEISTIPAASPNYYVGNRKVTLALPKKS